MKPHAFAPALRPPAAAAPALPAQAIGRAALAALHDELALAPKPGLVSFVDSGSHRDMDGRTFMRSLFALRHAFPHFAALGAQGVDFAALQAVGVAAEARMLRATGGVNTHRGAIFTLGLLCGAAGASVTAGLPLQRDAIRQALQRRWGLALAARDADARRGHGSRAARRLGLRGANAEAALGMPVLFDHVHPALQAALQQGLTPAAARLQALFAAMAQLDDTNLAHRGGLAALRWAQAAAGDWLRQGGAKRPDEGRADAVALHREFVARGLSPGGSADLLAAACWLQRVVAGGARSSR